MKQMKTVYFFLILFISLFLNSTAETFAQGEKQIISISGFIMDGNDAIPLKGIHIYIPQAGRGTVSDQNGYFSLNTLAGDTLYITSIGYKTKKLPIPNTVTKAYTVIINMQSEVLQLPAIEVFPYPTEEVFKKAFLALELKDKNYENLRENLSKESLARVSYNMPVDGSVSFKRYTSSQVSALNKRYEISVIPILSPSMISQIIKSIRRGDYNKENWKLEEE